MISALKVYLPSRTFSMVPLPSWSVKAYLGLPFSGVRDTVAKPTGSPLAASCSFTVTLWLWAESARVANRPASIIRILLFIISS